MYIIDDICYAGNNEDEIKIVDAKPLKGRMLLVTFSNKEIKLYDTHKLDGPVFDCLNDETIFKSLKLFHGFIQWCNGEVDIAPETVYADAVKYNTDELLTV